MENFKIRKTKGVVKNYQRLLFRSLWCLFFGIIAISQGSVIESVGVIGFIICFAAVIVSIIKWQLNKNLRFTKHDLKMIRFTLLNQSLKELAIYGVLLGLIWGAYAQVSVPLMALGLAFAGLAYYLNSKNLVL